MKALLLFGLIGGALVSASASAAIYTGTCQTCTGGASSGASWFAKAVAVAQANNAQEDDLIWLCKDLSGGSTAVAEYIVTRDPVVNSGDIAWTFTQGYVDVDCAGLGF